MKIFDLILASFQYCCYCFKPTFQQSHLCKCCQLSVAQNIRENCSYSNVLKEDCRGFPLFSLGSYRNLIFKKWIEALKGGDNKNDFTLIALHLLQKRQINIELILYSPVIIVPAPSRPFKGRDHSICLGKALSCITGWRLADTLIYDNINHTSQKSKNATERQNRKFKTTELMSNTVGTIIFIDDVVTTGSTAVAAWNALGKPCHFEVWCVAQQPLLARMEKT